MGTESIIYTTSAFTTLMLVVHWVIVFGLGVRIVLRRKATGVTLSWILIVMAVPFLGAIGYLLVGELWLPRKRIERYRVYKESIAAELFQIDEDWDVKGDALPPLAQALNAQANNPFNISAIGGNSFELFDSCNTCIPSIVRDIDRSAFTVHMLFYIWDSNGLISQVEQALIRAAQRGVQCRVLVDGAGSRDFLNGSSVQELRAGGVEVIEALPVGLLRNLFRRIDIRNHRKIISIDSDTAYIGSLNMVDPAFFHVGKKVGSWVDVMARVRGPASHVLDLTVCLDRAVEFHIEENACIQDCVPRKKLCSFGDIPLQVVPSGPGQAPRVTHDMLMTLIYNTRNRLIMTTPYFIPSEAMQTALEAAALRGVRVTLVVPERVDSVLVRHASRSYYEDLLEVGIEIRLYQGGLLHSKTVTADEEVAMLGTVNMDKRSFWINFEVSLFAYDREVVDQLRSLQEEYIADSIAVEKSDWDRRSIPTRLVDNFIQLFAPIL